jgi:hypothetical protein
MDQYNNHVDKEVWVPLLARDWIGTVGVGTRPPAAPTPVPLETRKQWALAHADGSVNEERYTNEGTALQELTYIRKQLKEYGIPEEYHPVLMERTVETVATSWKILSV